jgi:hypothetical protein
MAGFVVSCATGERSDKNSERLASGRGRTILGGDIPFRGRWWSYYQRGREYADLEEWTLARRDLETALQSRSADQLWARTYGMHFMSEYFPNRELGIVLYFQGKFEEAEPLLERSLAQQESARAEYYLNATRRSLLASSGTIADTEAPVINITSPSSDRIGGEAQVEVAGTIVDDTFVASLTVAGDLFDVGEARASVSFSRLVTLNPGLNQIELVARDLSGKETVESLVVNADLLGPVLVFEDSGLARSIVQGAAVDPAGVASLRINGVEVALDQQSPDRVTFSTRIDSEYVTYEARDRHGNTTIGSVQPAPGAASARVSAQAVYASGRKRPSLRPVYAVDAVDSPVALGRLAFVAPANETTFYQDFVKVTLQIKDPAPGCSLTLGGTEVPLQGLAGIPGTVHAPMAVRLSLGPNDLEARLLDATGKVMGEDDLRLNRGLGTLEEPRSKLSVTMLSRIFEGRSPELPGEANIISQELQDRLDKLNRFFVMSGDELRDEVLTEQQLIAMLNMDGEDRLFETGLWPEVVFIGRCRRDKETLEIVVHAVNTESQLFLSRADVNERVNSEAELDRCMELLVQRIQDNFPRTSGQVLSVRDESEIRLKPRIAISRSSWIALNPEYRTEIDDLLLGITGALFDRSNDVVLTAVRTSDVGLIDSGVSESSKRPRDEDEPYMLLGSITQAGVPRLHVELEKPDEPFNSARFDVAVPAEASDRIKVGRRLGQDIADWLTDQTDQVVRVKVSRAFNTSLADETGRFRESMKLIVYRQAEMAGVGGPLRPVILGEAVLKEVDRDSSIATLVVNSQAATPQLIQPGDFVIVK